MKSAEHFGNFNGNETQELPGEGEIVLPTEAAVILPESVRMS
jgi:hypothetical protein